nr:tyrosine-type recombinase/integrase [Deinococcus sp.]
MSPRTARAYREGIVRFLAHAQLRTVNLLRPGRDAGAVYVRSLETEGLKPASVRVHLAAARALFRALRWAGVTEADPFSDARPMKDKVAAWDKRSPYPEDEVSALLSHAPLRDQVLILLCAHGGLRISEALGLKWEDLQTQSLLVQRGKGGKSRRVVLSGTLVASLADFRQGRSTGLIIGGTQEAARKRLARIARLAGVESKGFHAFRHYAGTKIAGTLGLEDAARHLGHSSIETTRVYAKWADTSLTNVLKNW